MEGNYQTSAKRDATIPGSTSHAAAGPHYTPWQLYFGPDGVMAVTPPNV